MIYGNEICIPVENENSRYHIFIQINMTWFPFDEQICKLKFGSWTYPNASIIVDISDSGIPDKSANYSFRYQNRNVKLYGNVSFEEWYIKELEYEPNGVSYT